MKILVLFDIDGTILKFKHSLAKRLFAELLEDLFGVNIPDNAIPDFHGMTDLQIIKAISKNIDFPIDKTFELIPEIWKRMLLSFQTYTTTENINLLPGVQEIIVNLDNDPRFALGLLTGNFYENAYLKLKAVNLDRYFQFGAFGSDSDDRNQLPPIAISRAKEYFRFEFDFDNTNTIIIGDTHRDEECARLNNIACICVATGHQSYDELNLLKPDAVFRDLSQTDIIKNTIIELINEKNNNCN